jgi:flagellar hook protein FlgE
MLIIKGERKSMLRSMYSGVSGMKNFQTKLDVIGNNIANVNTYGFKKGRVTYKDLINQQIAGASAATNNSSGMNAKQVGLGSALSSIDTIHTAGSNQTTGRTLDLALAGDGFFVVGTIKDLDAVGLDTKDEMKDNKIADGTPIDDAIDLHYTRSGNFYLDDKGYLVTSDGFYLIGKAGEKPEDENGEWGEDVSESPGLIQVPLTAKSFNIGPDGKVSFVDAEGNLKMAGQILVANFANEGGLEKVGGNLYKQSSNSGTLNTNEEDGVQVDELSIPGQDGSAAIMAGMLEMSNVDLADEFTEMIVAQRGFQSNTKIITTSDEILQELMNLKR